MRARIVIIGGGIAGVCVALHAARRTDALREPVMLLDKGPIGAGSSGGSTAILRQFYAAPCPAGMARDSLKYLASFEAKTSRSVGFRQTGVLTLARARTEVEIERLRGVVAMMISIGIDVRVVEASEIRELVPGIDVPDATVGAWEPTAGFVDATLTLDALSTLAKDRGAVLRTGVPVERIEVDGDRVTAVHTSRGEIACDQVVLATGPWTRKLLADLGVELPLRVIRTEHFLIGKPEEAAREAAEPTVLGVSGPESSGATTWFHRAAIEEALLEHELGKSLAASARRLPASHPVLVDPELGFYARSEPHQNGSQVGRFDYGESIEITDPEAVQKAADPTFHEWARRVLEARLPFYRGVPEIGGSTAMYTVTPDAQALIGPVPGIEGLFVACGFSGHGFKLAPSVGEGLAQMLVGEPVSAFDAGFFDPTRFEGGHPVEPPIPFGA